MKYKKLTVIMTTFLSMVLMGQSALATLNSHNDFPRDEYLMGINWDQAPQDATQQEPRVNFSVPTDREREARTAKNDGLVSTRDEYLMGINWVEEQPINTSVSVSRVNFSVQDDEVNLLWI